MNETENNNSIFITNSESSDDMSGRITATSVLNTVPKEATIEKLKDWKKIKQTKWRWRFLEFGDRRTVEISYKKAKTNRRQYYNRFGKWVERNVPKEYDEFVSKIFYYYT